MSADEKLAPSERHKYVHGGRVIYEWDQSIRWGAGRRPGDLDLKARHLKHPKLPSAAPPAATSTSTSRFPLE